MTADEKQIAVVSQILFLSLITRFQEFKTTFFIFCLQYYSPSHWSTLCTCTDCPLWLSVNWLKCLIHHTLQWRAIHLYIRLDFALLSDNKMVNNKRSHYSMFQTYDNWLFLSHSAVCVSSLFIWRHVGTQRLFVFSLCVRKGTYSILASLLWRIQETGRKKWNVFLLFVVGKSVLFSATCFFQFPS